MSKPHFRVAINSDFTGEDNLKCPLCGDDYVHHLGTSIIRDGLDAYKAHPDVRGSTIELPMLCENGCLFTVFFGFHKGAVYVWAEEREAFKNEEALPDR